jgi:hypothetical protein
MSNHNSSLKRRLSRFDPVASLLIEKLNLSPLGFGLRSTAIATGLCLLIAWVSNTLWFKPGQVGLLQDRFFWIWVLFINPVVLGYYLWSFQAIENVIKDLEESDVVETNKSKIEETLNAYYQRWYKFLALGSAVTFSIFVFVTRSGLKKSSWTGSGPESALFVTIATFGVVYLGSMLVLNLITNVRVLHSILEEKELKVNPLHPDRCGGLRSLKDYSLKTAYLAAVLGIMVGLIEYQFITQGVARVYWFVHLIIPLHVALSMACFFGPLLAAHKGMKNAKEKILNEIAQQFQEDYLQMIHANRTKDAETFNKGTEKIKELRAFYTLTDEFPVWPFDVQTFRQYLLTVPTPLLPLLPKLIGLLLKKWGI